ncbi:hypothetical protein QL285_043949 [Trifolium repens]|nr:hypothetical protein QL285_043949 [Trifolium repens]
MSRSTRSDNPTMEDFRTTVSRRFFSILRYIPRSEQTHDDSTIHLQGLETTTLVRHIKEIRMNKEQFNLQHFPSLMNLMMLYKFIIDKDPSRMNSIMRNYHS